MNVYKNPVTIKSEWNARHPLEENQSIENGDCNLGIHFPTSIWQFDDHDFSI